MTTNLCTHSPRIIRGVPGVQIWTKIVGCACGWRTPSHVADSDTAFTEHLAIMRVAEGVTS